MKQYSNTYIFIFSAIMVIVVALLLSFVAINLKPLQDKNIEIEKKYDILRCVKKAKDADHVANKKDYIEKEYEKYIAESFVVNSEGKRVNGVEAFTVDLKKELRKPIEQRNLPVFVFSERNLESKYIFPLRGKGLWGPIWGYVSLKEDFNTIYGAIFDHKSETPGLGAEINTTKFQKQFDDKKIFQNRKFKSVKVIKGGAQEGDEYAVDAISGGTITSNALDDMIDDCLGSYKKFLIEKRNQNGQ